MEPVAQNATGAYTGGQAMLARGNGMRPASAHQSIGGTDGELDRSALGAAPRQSTRCVVCGQHFTASTYELRRGRARTCSPSCAGKAQALRHWPGPTVQLRTLEPGTRFRIETTEGVVVRHHKRMDEVVVRFRRYGSKTVVKSVWPACINVRVQ